MSLEVFYFLSILVNIKLEQKKNNNKKIAIRNFLAFAFTFSHRLCFLIVTLNRVIYASKISTWEIIVLEFFVSKKERIEKDITHMSH